MASYTQFIPGFAKAVSLEKNTVNVAAVALRKEGLMSSAGRGKSATITPPDASNLLVGLLAGGSLRGTPEVVEIARAAAFQEAYRSGAPNSKLSCPNLPFLIEVGAGGPDNWGAPRSFGDALDHLLDECVCYGLPRDISGNRLRGLEVTVGNQGLFAEIKFETQDDEDWTITYYREDPERERAGEEYALYDRKNHLTKAREIRRRGTVGWETLWEIGTALRGYEFDEFRTPYRNNWQP